VSSCQAIVGRSGAALFCGSRRREADVRSFTTGTVTFGAPRAWRAARWGCAIVAGLGILGTLSVAGWWLFASEERACKFAKMVRLDRCEGQDDSWQECRYYTRVIGQPDPKFCRAMLAAKSSSAGYPGDGPCESPGSWSTAACQSYGFNSWSHCFRCSWRSGFEASHLIVYAFKDDCSRGAAFATCNFPQDAALQKLGPAPE